MSEKFREVGSELTLAPGVASTIRAEPTLSHYSEGRCSLIAAEARYRSVLRNFHAQTKGGKSFCRGKPAAAFAATLHL
jgi:hypothetical protein